MASYLRRIFSVLLSLVLIVMIFTVPVHAQENLAPDRVDLAQRLLGLSGDPTIPPPSPAYEVGDTALFWVSKVGHDEPVQVNARLAALGVDIYIWVEEGIAYDRVTLRQMAGQLGQMMAILRVQANYPQVSLVPTAPDQFGVLPAFDLPDMDNDSHLYVLYTSDLADGQNAFYNPVNSLSPELVPGGYSNQHEMVFVNTSNFPDTPLSASIYFGILTRAFYEMVVGYNNPGQAAWLSDALAWYMLLYSQDADISADDLRGFFAAPQTSLTGGSGTGQEFGQGQLFLRYLDQRFGGSVLASLAVGSGPGLTALDAALRDNRISDPVTGDIVTGRDVFADFVMANVLNFAFGDGRYVHLSQAASGLAVSLNGPQDQFDFDLIDESINQLGTRYLVLQASRPAAFTLFFTGQPTVARLPMPEDEADNRFYWSGDVPNRDASMTRTVDLSGVDSATLTFDTWFNLAEDQHYAYVEVSTDGGATWTILPADDTQSTNPYALNYGTGFTGISSPEIIRPFPYLGVALDTNGLTITALPEDGPLAKTGAIVGDQIVGYDGEFWPEQPDIVGLVSGYEPGDTLNLLMQRGDETFELSVVLQPHPTRMRIPDAVWIPQTVDLSAYAGQSIQVRFESISLPGLVDLGIALDNIAVPEIGFVDDAESGVPGWTLAGWEQTNNQLDQRFLVQTAKVQSDTVHVTQLIAPADRATEGAWDFTLDAGEALVVAISGLNDNSLVPAQYSLSARSQGS
jgi:hypothetical protein